jgi:hypothetical protein
MFVVYYVRYGMYVVIDVEALGLYRRRRSGCRPLTAEQRTTTTACMLSYGVLLSFNSDISQSIFHKSLVIFD